MTVCECGLNSHRSANRRVTPYLTISPSPSPSPSSTLSSSLSISVSTRTIIVLHRTATLLSTKPALCPLDHTDHLTIPHNVRAGT